MKISDRIQNKIGRLIILYLVIGDCFPVFAQQETGREYELKATFIYNFTKFIQWPDSDSETFDVAIFGDSDIILSLEDIARRRSVNNRKITVKQYENVQDIDTCHILFISVSEKDKLETILQRIRDKNILTIGDSEGFAQKGVALNFVIINGKTKFEMNSRALERARLQVSSQLQKLAIQVEEER